jgi:molybdopterin converting factor small subunit
MNFTVEHLIDELTKDFGDNFKNLIINTKTKEVKPEILIFIDDKEIQTLQKLSTPLSDGNKIVFLSSIHGGSII